VLRVSALLLIALLPSTRLSQWFMLATRWRSFLRSPLLEPLRFLEANSRLAATALRRWPCGALSRNLGKFTFILLPAGMLVVIGLLWRMRRV